MTDRVWTGRIYSTRPVPDDQIKIMFAHEGPNSPLQWDETYNVFQWFEDTPDRQERSSWAIGHGKGAGPTLGVTFPARVDGRWSIAGNVYQD